MKCSEVGFRAFYHKYIAVPMKEKLRVIIQNFPGAEKANYILAYGYIDHEAGLTLEVLAAAVKTDDGFTFADTNPEIASKIRIGSIMEDDCFYFDDEDGRIHDQYANKVDALVDYDAGKEIEESRKLDFLDGARSPEYPDDVLVYLLDGKNQPERCWARIEGLAEHRIIGTLLNEPTQNFQYHKGDKIAFFVHQTDENEIVLVCDMNINKKITIEDLEDGTLLESAIHTFNVERSQDHLFDILEILRDSDVWIPCNSVMSAEDEKRLLAMLEEKGDKLIGEEFVAQGETRLIPDILQNGESFFFPVFSNVDAMGEYGERFSKIQKHFLDAITLAINNERELTGIVINAFTEPFILDKDLWNVIQKIKSRIEDN